MRGENWGPMVPFFMAARRGAAGLRGCGAAAAAVLPPLQGATGLPPLPPLQGATVCKCADSTSYRHCFKNRVTEM